MMATAGSVRDWMTTWANNKPPSLSADRATKILDLIDYRLSETEEDKNQVYALRYRAYLREGAILPSDSQITSDRYDDAPNSWIFGVYIAGELCSSIRISVVNQDYPTSSSVEIFGDVLTPEIKRGKTLIDPFHFVADPTKAKRTPELPYITVRLAYLACAHFDADLHLAIVRPDHQAFYRRVFHQNMIAEPRLFPGLLKPVGLLAARYEATREAIFERYPFMRSSNFERRMLFQRDSSKFAIAKRSLSEVKAHLRQTWGDDPVLPLCMKILNRVTISPINEAEILDFSALCSITGKNRPDSALLKAVTILSTSSFPTLRVCAKARLDDGRDYDLDLEDLSDAIDVAIAGENDPVTRKDIDEFTKKIVIHFVPTSIFENPPVEISGIS
jgi:hypothetical protein